jgi:voltage-gated potassium channel
VNLRKRVWEIVEAAKPNDKASWLFDIFLLSLILLNVIAVVVGSVQKIQQSYGSLLDAFETFSVIVFSAEYLARLWACTVANHTHPIFGRIKLILKPMTMVDLIAFLPFYLPFMGIDLRSLRALRLLRIIRIAKVSRYYSSLILIKHVFQSKKEELILTTSLMGILLVVSSSLMFYCENTVQPETFSSIPATMWWSVATLTTVGYGDIYPITLMGKLCASVISILGIGMFALPTGILGAGFVEEIQKRKTIPVCPHCGKQLNGTGHFNIPKQTPEG